MLACVSRWMLVFHSQLVVSGCPVPTYLAWSRSSSCWFRSLSAYSVIVFSIAEAARGGVVTYHCCFVRSMYRWSMNVSPAVVALRLAAGG